MSIRSKRCTAVRADGEPCRAWAVRGTDPPRCAAHGGTDAPIGAPQGNTNALKHGYYAEPSTLRRVAARIVEDDGAEPNRDRDPAGPEGESLSAIEGCVPSALEGWSIETVIIDLSLSQAFLSRYIRAHREDLTVEQLGGMLRIQGQNASRLGRLLRDRRALIGETDGRFEEALNRALDQLSAELGVDL
jgi:hypothetical protein